MNLYNKKYLNFLLVSKVHTFGTKGGYCVPSVPARSRHLPATPDLNMKSGYCVPTIPIKSFTSYKL